MRSNAVINHTQEMMLAIVGGMKEPNEGKMFWPWVKDDDTDTIYISATANEYRDILGKLIRREVLLPHEVAQKGNIKLTRKMKRSGS